MANKCLITGASGNIGSAIVSLLENENIDFTAATKSPLTKKTSYPIITIDYADNRSLFKAFEGVDVLFLLVPMTEAMVEFAQNVVYAAKSAGVRHIIRSSGAGANSKSSFMMPRIQGQIDDIIRQCGLKYTITLPKSFMQNFINYYAFNIKQGTVYTPTGNGKTAWVDVRDIAAVNVEILKRPDDFINKELVITGAKNFSLPMGLKVISAVTQKDIHYVEITDQAANEALRELGISNFNIEMLSSMNQLIKDGHMSGTTNIVEEVTANRPISFERFVKDHLSAWK